MDSLTPIVCTIGATDSWNAAGLGLDIRALAELGVRPVCVVAGVTAQDRSGVHAAAALGPDIIRAQFAALSGARVAAYRIGALLDAASIATVAGLLQSCAVPIVYDPVLAASAGGYFANAAARAEIVARLLPLATIVTPNLYEAATLAELTPPLDWDGMTQAAGALLQRGAHAVLVKGGHLVGDAADLFMDSGGSRAYVSPRLAGELRGSGCLLACGIAAGLALGRSMHEAIESARSFVRARFAAGNDVAGMRLAY